MPSKYDTLVSVLDQLRKDAPAEFKRYRPLESNTQALDQARSRALIHLYLKVMFGALSFPEREDLVTDGQNDGGVDAYFIDRAARRIYFIQAKFRTTSSNFTDRKLATDDILRMEVDRIATGEPANEAGVKYNSKIQALIRQIQEIEDIARYDFIVVLIANIRDVSQPKLRRLVGNFKVDLFNHERCYRDLVFPVINGTYYNSSDLLIDIDLSNKEYTQARIRYPVDTEFLSCEITLLFVPTVEIARILYKYKNSILRYNPRSYLALSHNQVNREIATTITAKPTNDFALFNNGITMLSDETSFSERTGRPYRGQLHVRNPQIINDGQTAYTLSDVYEKASRDDAVDETFEGKEVMLKVITFVDRDVEEEKKLSLIEAVSKATNQQTNVVEADRRSNDKVQLELQRSIFDDFGYFYERKRGEFFDGLRNKYIARDRVIEREILLRVGIALRGAPDAARRTSARVLFAKDSFNTVFPDASRYRDFVFGFIVYMHLRAVEKQFANDPANKYGVLHYGNALRYGKYSVLWVAFARLAGDPRPDNIDNLAGEAAEAALEQWVLFEEYARKQRRNREYFRVVVDNETGAETIEANFDSYYKVSNVTRDLNDFFSLKKRQGNRLRGK